MRFCNECIKKNCCDRCINQVDENKTFEAKLNLIKLGAPNQFGHMLPYYKEQLMWHLIFLRMIPCTSQINIILLKKIFHFNKFLFQRRML